jgi:hypothetical protein
LAFSVNETDLSFERVLQDIATFAENDDVFCADFLSQAVVLQFVKPITVDLQGILHDLQGSRPLQEKTWHSEKVYLRFIGSDHAALPGGPYFLHNGRIHVA